MSSVDDLRKKIDQIDAEIVRAIAERIRVADEIGKEKKQQGKQIEDIEREKIVLDSVKKLAESHKISTIDIESIYRCIIAAAKRAQEIEVAFQGEAGAYSEQATINYFGDAVRTRPCETFDEVFRLVEQKEVACGVVPIENSLEGSVNAVYDLLIESSLKVCGETEVRVSHCLIANPGVSLDSIKIIYSHPQALGQCKRFLKQLDRELVPTYDTAGSVKMIKEKGILDGAAIASARAAEIYGMKILAREIEDNPNNFTRFFVLSRQDTAPTGHDKTSVVFSVKHRPGSLYESLKVFSDRQLNLTKIESRPTRQKPWEYNFYLDFEGHREDKLCREALAELEQLSLFVRILGSYPRQDRGK